MERITTPGKFEGEEAWVPLAWSASLIGGCDEEHIGNDGSWHGIYFNGGGSWRDLLALANEPVPDELVRELDQQGALYLSSTTDGFVGGATFPTPEAARAWWESLIEGDDCGDDDNG